MNFYVSDLHFGHANVLKFDKRPFETVEEMDREMVRYWNETVDKDDHVYILGDFCWGKAKQWAELLPQLKGQKHLILGNHDLRQMPAGVRRHFASVDRLKEIVDDEGRHIIMCHYPLPIYRCSYNENMYMFYGHVHNTAEYELVKRWKYEAYATTNSHANLYNCWCGFYDWRPATFEQITAEEYAGGMPDPKTIVPGVGVFTPEVFGEAASNAEEANP